MLAPLISLAGVVLASTILWRAMIDPHTTFIGDLIVLVYLLMLPALGTVLGAFATGYDSNLYDGPASEQGSAFTQSGLEVEARRYLTESDRLKVSARLTHWRFFADGNADEFGQRLKGFVVLKEGGQVAEDELKAHVKANLARYKVPRDIVFLDELPRNPTGKILKRVLAERS